MVNTKEVWILGQGSRTDLATVYLMQSECTAVAYTKGK
jgi:hypothetical protein